LPFDSSPHRSKTDGPASMQNFVAATAIIAGDVEKLNGYIRQARKLKASRLALERQQKASEQLVRP
jgi:hypothetical protein